ncbi:NDT80 / PhoG like DNA-binding family protein [Metarhizium album ARSEF 1941]|uniref:NDT80 / PhoG like DNA-binding family protein n=1 Tax=Metarhizium album (strain ARSEF 1941) TaxID=1081103 RepID=A0A0B2WXB1_METAS|nr:NDT80 / PhoG like DNA-binding family protein [Metarhizium album ARSEF 1941]KHN98062.1 NDT80 / PhoG like DNA-binding family protein [Metarhizium album ARSEF 1941]
MAHVQLHNPRTTTLPQLGHHINNSRDQFANSVAPYRRASDHQFTRSPSFHGSRRQQHQHQQQHQHHHQHQQHQHQHQHQHLTGPPNPLAGYTPPVTRMDSHQYNTTHRPGQNDVPPLLPMEMMGTLQYMDPNLTTIKPDISGNIDKGPFLSSDREWTCYRRNYLACNCSFSLSPSYPGAGIQFTPSPMAGTSTTQTFQVYGFAMCISAVVADNEQHAIELVQHTPKRDKGPISKPSKTPIAPKTSATPHGASLGIYGDGSGLSSSRGLYSTEGFGGQVGVGVGVGVAQQVPTEHTFERIQFKQATQNNGKRRAAQQYYHLVVELWADVGAQATDQFVKVALRKSAKMIVRGRSPGHYQNERRNSQGNGTGGAAGSGGYRAHMGHMGDFGNGSGMAGAGLGAYSSGYDGRGISYTNVRHQEMSPESIFSSGDDKPSSGKAAAYHQYYNATCPGAGTAGGVGGGAGGGGAGGATGTGTGTGAGAAAGGGGGVTAAAAATGAGGGAGGAAAAATTAAGGAASSSSYDSHGDRVDLFGHRNGADALHSAVAHERKVKPEFDFNMLPSPFGGGQRTDDHHRERFDGRPSPGGFYPSIVPPTGLGAL